MAAEENTNTRWLMEQWTRVLASAIESMSEQRPQIEFTSQPPDKTEDGEAAGPALAWEQSFRGIPAPALWVRAPEKSWMEIGARTLRTAGIEAPEPADIRNTYLEILNQSLAALARSVGARRGHEAACEGGCEREPTEPPAERFGVMLHYTDAELALEMKLSAALVGALDEGSAEARTADTGAPEVQDLAPAPLPAASKTMDLLLDVDLPVSVSFGRAELPVKEILKLTTGSVVELDRSLNEPVDVIVNNCVVARGEVVVIEGNYGVRIHRILSRQDRLRSLK